MNQKNEIRQEVLKLRNQLIEEEVNEKSQIIKRKIFGLPFFSKIKKVMGYMDFNNEVKAAMILNEIKEMGIRVFVPVCMPKDHSMLVSEVLDWKHGFVKSHLGILEPSKEAISISSPETLDMVLVPGVAFDKQCSRIGFGAGYYDRFLASLPPHVHKIGLAFDIQMVEKVPVEPHDIPLDMVITDKNIYTRL